MKVKLNIFIILALSSLLSACSSFFYAPSEIDPTNLAQLENLRGDDTHIFSSGAAPDVGRLRLKALEDTAMSLAAQGSLASASEEINKHLTKIKWSLETTYNFSGMMLSHGVIPPVLEEGDNSLNLADPGTIRVADKTYKILEQARFATTPPHWREYLWMTYTKPELPHKFLLPRDDNESRVWRKALDTGWQKGIQQAFSIFQQNLARLKRDYKGMILYRKLLQEKMISPPYVSRTELGVTGNESDMRINDQVLRITALPKLQTDSKGWKAIVVQPYVN